MFGLSPSRRLAYGFYFEGFDRKTFCLWLNYGFDAFYPAGACLITLNQGVK